MLAGAQEAEGTGTNHPLAFRMAGIAFLTNNVTIGTLYGSFSVLLGAVETRLGVGRELSTLGIPAVNLAMAVCAPIVGLLAGRVSLRLLMTIGMALLTIAFLLLGLTHSYPLYLIAYGLLLGPGMAVGVVLPATLVTRWYRVGRGRALGIISTPAMIAVLPLIMAAILQSFGLTTAYFLLAAIAGVAVIAALFIVDRPPTEASPVEATPSAHAAADPSAMTVADIVRNPRFWALSVAACASNTSSIILAAHMVPMAGTWGFSPTLAATLLATMSLIGIIGTILFGWIADKLGGPLALALVLFDGAVLWTLLLLHPPYPILLILIGIIGLHGAGVLPVLSLVLSQTFGRDNFSRVYGIASMVNLPFSVACVPLAALAYTATGSYSLAIIGQVIFFGIATLLALSARPAKARLVHA
ncbi:MAG TPA: MFS transporter [Sphingobium sp.]|uniref:MFS transporter n=1 Tax=Sphingobium sp. TaxID=1912891 RepID=UPI002ED46088